jgi:GNAT superfamily N-acetyltransferase
LLQQIFSDFELGQRLEQAEGLSCARFIEARARVAPKHGACWTQIAGAYAMFDGPQSPITQSFGLGMSGEVTPAQLDELEAFFESRGSPVLLEVSPLAGVPLVRTLTERGYKPIELTSVMFMPTGCPDAGTKTENHGAAQGGRIRVRTIRPEEQAERELWAEITARGWAETPGLTQFLLDLGNVISQKKNSTAFLAEIEGEPVAAASLSMEGGVGLFAGACTVREARRQGAQRALLHARLEYAASHGCDLAMMCAAPGSTSQRNAERHGFRIAYTRTKWQLARAK